MRIRFYLVVLASVATGLVAWQSCGGEKAVEVGVTRELAGTWETTSPGHADRYIEIGTQEIAFGQGEEGEARYPILGVLRSQGPEGRSSYLIRYLIDAGEDAEGKLEVLVGDSQLTIASQPEISWTLQR